MRNFVVCRALRETVYPLTFAGHSRAALAALFIPTELGVVFANPSEAMTDVAVGIYHARQVTFGSRCR
jgi:hypothetical protein